MKKFFVTSLAIILLLSLLLAACSSVATTTQTSSTKTTSTSTTAASTTAKTTTTTSMSTTKITTTTTTTQASQSAADFYKGKTIIIMVPSSPGGTFDLISRAMAPYLEKYTGASAQIQNSKNIEAQNKLAAAKPDGLSVILSGHGPKEITAGLFKQVGVTFDWTKFTMLGRIPLSSTAIVVDPRLGWKTVSDPVGKSFFLGVSTPFFEPLFAEALGWNNMRVIPGMSGADRALAMRRGEIQGTSAGAAQVSQNPDIMQPLVVTTKDEKGFKGIPVISDVSIKGKEQWGKWAAAWDQVMYWSYATPGIPQDRAGYLENALAQMFKDPEFIVDMYKLNIDLSPTFVTAKQLKEITNTMAALTADEIAQMKSVIEQKYLKQ